VALSERRQSIKINLKLNQGLWSSEGGLPFSTALLSLASMVHQQMPSVADHICSNLCRQFYSNISIEVIHEYLPDILLQDDDDIKSKTLLAEEVTYFDRCLEERSVFDEIFPSNIR
jgi:hypothetical protein